MRYNSAAMMTLLIMGVNVECSLPNPLSNCVLAARHGLPTKAGGMMEIMLSEKKGKH